MPFIPVAELSRANDIVELLKLYPGLRVAYVDEISLLKDDGKLHTTYYSVLVRWHENTIEELYRIELPGPMKLGEGKPENQNHAIVFTRGEGLQVMYMHTQRYTLIRMSERAQKHCILLV